MKLKLANLETSMDPLVAEDSKKALQMEFEIFKVMQKRKRLATDMINAIMENSPMSKRELLVGIFHFSIVGMKNTSTFNSISTTDFRELTEDDRERLERQDTVNEFKQRKLEIEAQKNWDRFYHRNHANFFKDRNWSGQDIQEICSDMNLRAPLTYLEAGCGVGNMLFPLKSAFPNFRLHAFDFSKRAVQMCSERAKQLNVGGSVIVRDYAINDYAMIRFGRGAKLADRFYVRQDGTRVFYFRLEELVALFEAAGFKCIRKEYLHRQTVNHQKQLNVPRVFVQARFVKC
ncbi:hypothetical protein DICVIV_01352 [Dictyocaulus viviparus]|uniref:Methyltransferase domain-containing protein n=1 Tax=Dictyocaulus viviparus TaxID=29172 RepID=A0A0D8YD34_DICVI|nr:hypothetical protein DICVIV_01352 [Dictyocaulus viviparus]